MNIKLRRQLQRRNRKLRLRLDKHKGPCRTPMIRPARTKFELSEKQQAISCGGIGLIMQVVEQLGLRKHINSSVVELIAIRRLDGSFARHLHKSLRPTFRKLVRNASALDDE